MIEEKNLEYIALYLFKAFERMIFNLYDTFIIKLK